MTRIPRRTRGYYIGGYPDWEERATVIRMHARGLSFRQIGDALGISRQAAHQVFHRGIRDLQRPSTPDDDPRW
jgi:DNA-directed RNA polymerase specialized sigma24 family protein